MSSAAIGRGGKGKEGAGAGREVGLNNIELQPTCSLLNHQTKLPSSWIQVANYVQGSPSPMGSRAKRRPAPEDGS